MIRHIGTFTDDSSGEERTSHWVEVEIRPQAGEHQVCQTIDGCDIVVLVIPTLQADELVQKALDRETENRVGLLADDARKLSDPLLAALRAKRGR